MLRYYIIFKGNVQGVGFRFTTEKIASKYGIRGFVKNRSDGSVEVVAEGSCEKLNLFLGDINDYFKSYIHNYSKKELPTQGEFSDFRIAFY